MAFRVVGQHLPVLGHGKAEMCVFNKEGISFLMAILGTCGQVGSTRSER
jgi:hypothetical protein